MTTSSIIKVLDATTPHYCLPPEGENDNSERSHDMDATYDSVVVKMMP